MFFSAIDMGKLLVGQRVLLVSGYGAGILIASHSEMASSLVSQCLQAIATVKLQKFLTIEGGQEFESDDRSISWEGDDCCRFRGC